MNHQGETQNNINVGNNGSLNTLGNASLRSLSSGYESLILEASGKPQLTLDFSSSNALSSRQHPKLQDNDLLKPVVPPFHLPPGFESATDDIFTRPFGSPSKSDDVSANGGFPMEAGVGARALSGTATSPMPPGRTSRPVAKLFASHQSGKKNSSPSSSAILSASGGGGGGGTPSPHSSGGASSVSAVLRLPHSSSGGSGNVKNAQNSSLLMSSGMFMVFSASSNSYRLMETKAPEWKGFQLRSLFLCWILQAIAQPSQRGLIPTANRDPTPSAPLLVLPRGVVLSAAPEVARCLPHRFHADLVAAEASSTVFPFCTAAASALTQELLRHRLPCRSGICLLHRTRHLIGSRRDRMTRATAGL